MMVMLVFAAASGKRTEIWEERVKGCKREKSVHSKSTKVKQSTAKSTHQPDSISKAQEISFVSHPDSYGILRSRISTVVGF